MCSSCVETSNHVEKTTDTILLSILRSIRSLTLKGSRVVVRSAATEDLHRLKTHGSLLGHPPGVIESTRSSRTPRPVYITHLRVQSYADFGEDLKPELGAEVKLNAH